MAVAAPRPTAAPIGPVSTPWSSRAAEADASRAPSGWQTSEGGAPLARPRGGGVRRRPRPPSAQLDRPSRVSPSAPSGLGQRVALARLRRGAGPRAAGGDEVGFAAQRDGLRRFAEGRRGPRGEATSSRSSAPATPSSSTSRSCAPPEIGWRPPAEADTSSPPSRAGRSVPRGPRRGAGARARSRGGHFSGSSVKARSRRIEALLAGRALAGLGSADEAAGWSSASARPAYAARIRRKVARRDRVEYAAVDPTAALHGAPRPVVLANRDPRKSCEGGSRRRAFRPSPASTAWTDPPRRAAACSATSERRVMRLAAGGETALAAGLRSAPPEG